MSKKQVFHYKYHAQQALHHQFGTPGKYDLFASSPIMIKAISLRDYQYFGNH